MDGRQYLIPGVQCPMEQEIGFEKFFEVYEKIKVSKMSIKTFNFGSPGWLS